MDAAEIAALNDRIIYEDNHLLVVNKAASEIVQGDKTGDMPLNEKYKQVLKEKYQKPGNVFVGVIHRLDRPTTGVIIFAKTSKALARLNDMIKFRKIRKIYWAVTGEPLSRSEGELVHYMTKNERKNKSKAHPYLVPDSKKAILRYRLKGESDRYYLYEVELHTGRHHQIRAQFSAMGSPLKGDLKYGFHTSNPDASIHLHARQILFEHPVKGENIVLYAPVPDENLWKYFEQNYS
ncbi:MAG: RluA family pseudouridine synthase [Bacteroidota bacterium]